MVRTEGIGLGMPLPEGLVLPKGPDIEGASWPPAAPLERAPALFSRASEFFSTEIMPPIVSVRMFRMLLLC